MGLMIIVEKFGSAMLGIVSGGAVLLMFGEILNYASSF